MSHPTVVLSEWLQFVLGPQCVHAELVSMERWTLLCTACVGTVQFVAGPDGKPTEAILNGVGAQATFQNTAGQVVVVTNNSPGTVTIPIDSNGNPSIPAGINLSVVSTNSSIPSTPTSSSSGVNGNSKVLCVVLCTLAYLQTSSLCPLSLPCPPGTPKCKLSEQVCKCFVTFVW